MIILNPNPCFDRTLLLSRMERGAVMRCDSAQVSAGGKGINVARVARALAKPAPLLILVGDRDAEEYSELLAREGADFRVTSYAGRVRIASIYLEKDSSSITVVNEKGSAITALDWQAYLDQIKKVIKPEQIIACMGSFPTGVTEEMFISLVNLVHQNQGIFLIDTAPLFLAYALAAGADIVSPNLDEAESLIYGSTADLFTGDNTDAQKRSKNAAVELCKMGAKIAMVTAGEAGVAIAYRDKVDFVPSAKVKVVSAVGAGDSFVAGFILKSEEQGDFTNFNEIDWTLSAAFGCATAAASCETSRAGELDPVRVSAIFRLIQTNIASSDMAAK
jgi:1-phosphofructokinase family hexose kinase